MQYFTRDDSEWMEVEGFVGGRWNSRLEGRGLYIYDRFDRDDHISVLQQITHEPFFFLTPVTFEVMARGKDRIIQKV